MTTDENIEFLSVSVAWDSADTVVSSVTEWGNFLVSFTPFVTMAPINPTNTIIGQLVTSFDAVIAPLDSGFGILPGTYQIGTIVFTHSSPWTTTTYNANIFNGIDTFATAGGVDITGSVTLGSATVNVVPEPGTAALLGMGLIGLVLAGRRKRA